MSVLPNGWVETTIGDVADVQLGRQRSPENHTGDHMRPYLRSANVTWDGISLHDVKEMNFDPEDAKRFELQEGDLLLNEASGSPNEVGKPAIWRNEIPGTCFQNTLLRVRSHGVATRYMYWYCYRSALFGEFGEAGRGVNIRHLGKRGLQAFPIPVPPEAEQGRIAAAIEEHLSRLDAAESLLHRVQRNLERLWRRCLLDEIEDSADLVAIEDLVSPEPNALAIGPFGSNLKVSDYRESGVPLVFVRDVRAGSFGGPGTKYVEKAKATELRPHEVCDGDVLVTKMGDPPGDTAVYRGPPAIITADCIKIRTAPSVVPEFVAVALRTQRAATEIAHITQGVAQKKVSLGRFRKLVHIPLPPLDVQHEILWRLAAVRATVERQQRTVEVNLARAAATRRSVLAAAFAGSLVAQDPMDEPASELLDRIRSAASQNPSRKGTPA